MNAPPTVKRLRSSSTSYNEREPCRSLISLPVELVTCIIDQVEDSRDYLALSKTCRALYRPCSLRALVARFGEGRGLNGKLYCLNPSYLVGVGLWPFAIIGAHWVDQGQDVALEVVELGLDALRETPNNTHMAVSWTEYGVSLNLGCNCWRYGRTATLVRWNSMARGRLAVMTSARMVDRFECPECGDTREVETGPELASRWSALTHDLDPIYLPCPRCTVTYQIAHDFMHGVAYEIALFEAESEAGSEDVCDYIGPFQVAEESAHLSPNEDSDTPISSPSSTSSSDWYNSDEEGEAEESDSDIDEPSTEQDDLSREFEASLRALAENWSVDDSDDSQSICSSARSLDKSDDSDDEATSAEDEGPLDMIDLRAEAEAVQRAFEDEADEKCRYDQKLAASDEQEPDWWFPYGFPPSEWEWLEGYEPTFSDDEWSEGWRRSRESSDRASSSDGGEGPGQRYDGELGWTGGKGERDEGWYDAQEERGIYWW